MPINNFIQMKYIISSLICLFIIACNGAKEKTTSDENILQPKENEWTEKQFPVLDSMRYNVGFLIMDGVYNTELTAPFDIFQHTIFRKNIKEMNVFTVADTDAAVLTFEGIRILPDYNYLTDNVPGIDILVVPSAAHHLDSDLENEAMLNFVRKAGNAVSYTHLTLPTNREV